MIYYVLKQTAYIYGTHYKVTQHPVSEITACSIPTDIITALKPHFAKLEAEIQGTGTIYPLVLDEDGFALRGITRFIAAKRHRLTSVPACVISGLSISEKVQFALEDLPFYALLTKPLLLYAILHGGAL